MNCRNCTKPVPKWSARGLCRSCYGNMGIRELFQRIQPGTKTLLIGICRHCHETRCLRPRRLCAPCYNDPLILSMYRSAVCSLDNRGTPSVPVPTDAKPGSEEKVRVMIERYANNEEIFHELDAQHGD